MAINYFARPTVKPQLPVTSQPSSDEPGLLGNMGRAAGSGALSATGGILDFFGAKGIAKQFYGWSDDARQSMSQEAQVDMAKPFFDENEQNEIQLGEGLADIDTWLLTLANVAGQFAPTAIPGAGMAGAATKALSLGEKGARIATAAGMGATGGAAATGQGMEQARQEWLQMPDEIKAESEFFRESIRKVKQADPGLAGDDLWSAAEQDVAEQLARDVQTDPAVLLANFAGSAIADPIIGKALTGARLAKSGAFRSAAKGFAIEGTTEAAQAGVQEHGINRALSQIDGRDPMDGVAVAALNEGIAGGAFGGAAGMFGGLANRKQAAPVRDPSADAIRDSNSTLASTMDAMAQSAAQRQADMESIIGMPAISQPVLEGELLGPEQDQERRYNENQIGMQPRIGGPTAPRIEQKDIIFAADGRTEAERNPAMEGDWLGSAPQTFRPVGLLGRAPIDIESEQVKQAKAEMERLRNEPRQITDKNVIFAGDGRPQQAAQEFTDNLQRQASRDAAVPRLPQKDIIFAGDESGVRVKGNGLPYQSAKEAITSKQARAAKRSGVEVEAVQFAEGWGWQATKKPVDDSNVVELDSDQAVVTRTTEADPAQQPAQAMPSIEFPTKKIADSYRHISTNPRNAGLSEQESFNSTINAITDEVSPLIETDEQRAAFESAIAQFKEGYINEAVKVADVRQNTVSWHVAGRNNFNSKQAARSGGVYEGAQDSFSKWIRSNVPQVKSAVLAARTPEQVQTERDKTEETTRQNNALKFATQVGYIADDIRNGRVETAKDTRKIANAEMEKLLDGMDEVQQRKIIEISDNSLKELGGLINVVGARSNLGKRLASLVNSTAKPSSAEAQPAPIQLMKSGQSFSTEKAMKISASYKAAAATGAELETVPVDGGFGFRVKAAPAPAADLSGEPINDEWTAFADDSDTLKIPRAEMPQIKAEHRGAMTQFLKARGVNHEQDTVPAAELKPTQAEFSPSKVAKAMEYEGGDRSILVSSDGYVLDGHHQWLAKRERGEQVDIIRFDAPISELVKQAHEFPSSTVDTKSSINARQAIPARPTGKQAVATTPAGRDIDVEYQVVEADSLVTSNLEDGRSNPDFPPELQPRDRSRAASMDQINRIAGAVNPRLLAESATTSDGAPIISADGIVESGNGRSLGLRKAYRQSGAEGYRQFLSQNGYDVEGMKQPVLVRVRRTELSPEDRLAYIKESNQRTTLEMSATEQAASDAAKMSRVVVDYSGGEITSAENRNFVRNFVQNVAGEAERGGLMDSSGVLSQNGRRRIEAALLSAAYGDDGIVAEVFESGDTDIKAIGGALLDAAGKWAQMRNAGRDGMIADGMDVTPFMLEAVNLIRRARSDGKALIELVSTDDIFSGALPDATRAWLSIFYRGDTLSRARGRDKVAQALNDYADEALKTQPGDGLFGDVVTSDQVMGVVNERIKNQEGAGVQQGGLFTTGNADNGEGGAQAGQRGQGSRAERTNGPDREQAEKPKVTAEPASQTPANAGVSVSGAPQKPSLEYHISAMKAVRDGNATVESYQAAFSAIADNKDVVIADLNKLTKPELLKIGGGMFSYRNKDGRKAEVVEALYEEMLREYSIDRSYGPTSYFMTGKGIADHKALKEKALRDLVQGTTEEDLEAFASGVTKARDEYTTKKAAHKESLENPQTLADFNNLMRSKISDGMTKEEAFLSLTQEQRIRYDELAAEVTKQSRDDAKRAAKTMVKAAGQQTTASIVETKHTKTGQDLFVVKLDDRLSSDDYKTVLASAKKLGGWYSSFRGNGAVPGFQFKELASAEAFAALAAGDTSQAEQQVQTSSDVFEDDKSQSAADRLNTMAEKLEQRAEEESSRPRLANTARRARFAAAAEASAERDLALAGTMRNIANAISNGAAKFIDAVRQKTQVEYLQQLLSRARYDEIKAKYTSYQEQENQKHLPVTAETVDFVQFPSFTAYRSDLATLARQMLEIDGLKKLGQQLMSVADDVTDAYLEFAKENLYKVATFTKRNTDGSSAGFANFSNKGAAETAIRRSGHRGKAIVLPFKRGENIVIMSPSEAMNRGVWSGDGDKRITLSKDFGSELVQAIGRKAKAGNGISIPWQLESAYENLEKLKRMGLQTAPELRSALREFVSLKEDSKAPDKVRQMEREMVGRVNDGLDFFPTPQSIATQMIEAAELAPDMAVLEPSAGMGHIAEAIRGAGVDPDVVEFSANRRELLELKGFNVLANDFTEVKPRSFYTYGDTFKAPDGTVGVMKGSGGLGSNRVRLVDSKGEQIGFFNRDELEGIQHNGTQSGYDRIIMNPPFSNRRDAEHVQHAYTLLKPGGRIVAIMGEGVFFGEDKKAEAFREWLDSVGGTSERLPENSFMDKSLPVTTGVNTRMVVIDKPESTIQFSKQNTIKAKPSKGVSSKLAKQFVAGIMKSLNGAAGIKVVVLETQAEAEKLWQMSLSGDLVRGAYNRANNTAYVIAENIKSMDELREVVAHEVIGHGGLNTVINPTDFAELIERLKKTRSNKAFATQWAKIDEDYDGFSEEDKAEEIFAYFVQNKPVVGPVKLWWNAMKRFLHRALVKVGLAKAGDPDVEAMQDMLESIRTGFMFGRGGADRGVDSGLAFRKSQPSAGTFNRWFGGSKVVDENGEPLIVYHGTNADFSVFAEEKLGEATGAAFARMGFFFASNPNVASSYADTDSTYNIGLTGAINRWTNGWYEKVNEKVVGLFGATARTDGGNVMPVYLAIKNPLVVDQAGKEYREQTYYDILVRAKNGGHDGVIIKNTFDEGFMDLGDELTDVYIAFEPTQIKSATGNNGDFDPSNPDIRFSRTRTSEQADALDKLGLGEEAAETVAEQAKRRANETVDTLKNSSFWQRLNEGIFDGLAGIKQAEDAAGITDPNQQGYVSARLASGLSDILHGVFHYGAPEWRDGVVQRKADTKGLLEVFGMLGDDLNDWLAWMGANRAERLMAEGRENNLSQADIDELKAMAAGKEALFEQVRQEYNKINSAIIDLAEDAGLLSAEQRGGFDEEWYVPFFRNMEDEVDPEMSGIAAMVHGPRSRKGIAGQSAQIKELKGGRQSTKDLLENIIQRQSTMIDAAIKNKAMAEVVSNLEGTPFMQAVDSPDIAALSQTELNLLQKVKVMRNGKAEAYTVTDPALLRGLLQIHTIGNQSLFNRMARSAKRFLTAGITLSPDFIVKNFVRDAAHAWMINKDGFRFGADSVNGLRKAFAEDETYRDLIFSGAAFQGGYVHGADPDAAAQQIRRALRSKGLAEAEIQSYMDSLITKGGELLEAYRTASDKVENANRLSTYEAALSAGKSRKQAAYEAKDLMDYSLKGNFAMIGTMIDMLPFFNARLQGMSKLVRSMKGADGDRVLKVLSANLAMKGLKVAAFSLALAAMNDDDERYQELPDWDKDANWHFFIGDEHFRIPKPFELGIIFGTMPERMFHYAAGNQPGGDLGKAAAHAVWNTLALNPIPQLVLPVVEVMTNKSFFKNSQIEGMGDAQRQPEDRYNAYTSETAKQIGAAFGVSPKMVEHLILGYTGTLGGYVLGAADIAARKMLDIEAADTPISRYPVVKAFYQGDAPKTSTKFQDEFYKALEAAGESYGSYKRAVEEGDVVRQQELKADDPQALGARVQLSRIQRKLSELNKQAEVINNNKNIDGAQKRQRLDEITARKNALYSSAYVRFKLGEW